MDRRFRYAVKPVRGFPGQKVENPPAGFMVKSWKPTDCQNPPAGFQLPGVNISIFARPGGREEFPICEFLGKRFLGC